MFKNILFLATAILGLNSCCYCVINMPDPYYIPEECELVEYCDTDPEVIVKFYK